MGLDLWAWVLCVLAAFAVGLAKGSDLLAPINEILAGIDDATRDELMAGAKERQPLNQ